MVYERSNLGVWMDGVVQRVGIAPNHSPESPVSHIHGNCHVVAFPVSPTATVWLGPVMSRQPIPLHPQCLMPINSKQVDTPLWLVVLQYMFISCCFDPNCVSEVPILDGITISHLMIKDTFGLMWWSNSTFEYLIPYHLDEYLGYNLDPKYGYPLVN